MKNTFLVLIFKFYDHEYAELSSMLIAVADIRTKKVVLKPRNSQIIHNAVKSVKYFQM